MSGHTQQVIRHLPEENKLKETRNLDRQPYSQRTTINLHYNPAFDTVQCSFVKAVVVRLSNVKSNVFVFYDSIACWVYE